MNNLKFVLNLYKNGEFVPVPDNMQKIFFNEDALKNAVRHSKFYLKKLGITHYEAIEHRESFKSKGKKIID